MENSINISKELVSKAQEALKLMNSISEETGHSLAAMVYESDCKYGHISIYGDHSVQNGRNGFTVFEIYVDGHIDVHFTYDDVFDEVSDGENE